jgi:hypothetical protein
MKKVIFLALAFVAIAISQQTVSHSGGTDEYGCHVESATGIRHCH